jgi:phosphoribosylformimino-5-aminoimidazole carboxamide ribotide isomerase
VVIIPAIDLMGSQVVRGVAGQREHYRPLVSRIARSSDPSVVAAAFAEHFGLTELYLADLDAIGGKAPARKIYDRLLANGFRLWVDAGIRDVAQVRDLAQAGIECVVVGLETIADPDMLGRTVELLGERVAFSHDLRHGQPVGNLASWPEADARGITARAVALGVRRVLVLDLAQVGTAAGTATKELCRWLATTYPQVEVYAGGGVRDATDLRRMRDADMHGALVASALHDGALSRTDLAEL